MRWSELDLDEGVLSLPAARTKNARRASVLPITPLMQGVISKQEPARVGADHLFGKRGFSTWSHCKGRLDEQARRLGGEVDAARRCRRSAASGFGESRRAAARRRGRA